MPWCCAWGDVLHLLITVFFWKTMFCRSLEGSWSRRADLCTVWLFQLCQGISTYGLFYLNEMSWNSRWSCVGNPSTAFWSTADNFAISKLTWMDDLTNICFQLSHTWMPSNRDRPSHLISTPLGLSTNNNIGIHPKIKSPYIWSLHVFNSFERLVLSLRLAHEIKTNKTTNGSCQVSG